jgi:hypothetical protein
MAMRASGPFPLAKLALSITNKLQASSRRQSIFGCIRDSAAMPVEAHHDVGLVFTASPRPPEMFASPDVAINDVNTRLKH